MRGGTMQPRSSGQLQVRETERGTLTVLLPVKRAFSFFTVAQLLGSSAILWGYWDNVCCALAFYKWNWIELNSLNWIEPIATPCRWHLAMWTLKHLRNLSCSGLTLRAGFAVRSYHFPVLPLSKQSGSEQAFGIQPPRFCCIVLITDIM